MKVVSIERSKHFDMDGLFVIKVRMKAIPFPRLEKLWMDHGFLPEMMKFHGKAGVYKSGYGFNEPVIFEFRAHFEAENRFIRQFLPALKKLGESLSFDELNAPKGESFIQNIQPWT